MRVLSLFSGMGGFDLALERAGMTVVGQVELDKDCQKVLANHWSDVWRVEDVRSVGLGRAADHVEGQPYDAQERAANTIAGLAPIDLVCGGFPCQDLSVAGKRAGLDGERSGLWFEFHRIVSELRPTYALVENVPGLLSSNQGRDFAVIIDGLGELGYGVSWTVLDSQHFGVPQRRRRVFIVAGPPDGRTEAILAISEGCGGHPAESRAAGEDVAAPLGASTTSFGGQRYDLDNETYVPELSYAQPARNAKGVSLLDGQDTFVVRTAQTSANGIGVQDDQAYTLDGTGGQAVAHTLRAEGFDASEDGTGRGTPLVAAFTERTRAQGRNLEISEEQAYALTNPGSGGRTHSRQLIDGASVRRLTPTECLRLQGFPDDWFDGLGLSDGAKYRMCGNAITVPVVEWIGRRMMGVERG